MENTKNDLADRFLAHIREYDYVSFAGLQHAFPEIVSKPDGWALESPKGKNIVIWTGLTREAVDAFGKLHKAALIVAVPCDFIIYAIDGEFPTLPLAKGPRDYKTLHWLPVTLRPFEKCPKWLQDHVMSK